MICRGVRKGVWARAHAKFMLLLQKVIATCLTAMGTLHIVAWSVGTPVHPNYSFGGVVGDN